MNKVLVIHIYYSMRFVSNTQEGLEILCAICVIRVTTVTLIILRVAVMAVARVGITDKEFAVMRAAIFGYILATPVLAISVGVTATEIRLVIAVTVTGV